MKPKKIRLGIRKETLRTLQIDSASLRHVFGGGSDPNVCTPPTENMADPDPEPGRVIKLELTIRGPAFDR